MKLKELEMTETEPAVRTDDHVTSKKAAKRVKKDGLSKRQQRVIEVLQGKLCGLADFEIRALCNKLYGPAAESTYRKRRSELFKAGLVKWNGQKRVNEDGNEEKVWVLVEKDV